MTPKSKRDLILIGLIVLSALLCCSCKTKTIVVPEYHTDTTYITKTQYDSIWAHDSIYLHEYIRGETLFVEKEKWHTLYREKIITDTLYKSKVDSIPVPYPVEKKQTFGQRCAIKLFPFFFLLAIALLIWVLRKPIGKLIRKLILRI